MLLLAEGFVFGGDDWGFLKEDVKTYLMAPTSPLNLQTFFSVFTSIVYGQQIGKRNESSKKKGGRRD